MERADGIVRGALGTIVTVYKAMDEAGMTVREAGEEVTDPMSRQARHLGIRRTIVGGKHGHDTVEHDGGWRCTKCGRTTTTRMSIQGFHRVKCEGPKLGGKEVAGAGVIARWAKRAAAARRRAYITPAWPHAGGPLQAVVDGRRPGLAAHAPAPAVSAGRAAAR